MGQMVVVASWYEQIRGQMVVVASWYGQVSGHGADGGGGLMLQTGEW